MPKSGSTFLAQVATLASVFGNGFDSNKNRKEFRAEFDKVRCFTMQLTDEFVDDIERQLPVGTYHVIKTHGLTTPKIRAGIRDRRIKAFTSFRDPRDCALSFLDAGIRDRAMGEDRPFSDITSIEVATKRVASAMAATREWTNLDGVLSIPYYLIVADQFRCVELICHHIGLAETANSVQNLLRQDEPIK
jgi:hypothetical protein